MAVLWFVFGALFMLGGIAFLIFMGSRPSADDYQGD